LASSEAPPSGRSAATSVLKLSGVRLSTVGLPVARPPPQAPPAPILGGRARSPSRPSCRGVPKPFQRASHGNVKSKNHTSDKVRRCPFEVRTIACCKGFADFESGHRRHISLNR
jgi:hypothetical protein